MESKSHHYQSASIPIICQDCGFQIQRNLSETRLTVKCPRCYNIMATATPLPEDECSSLNQAELADQNLDLFCPRCQEIREDENQCGWCGLVFHKALNMDWPRELKDPTDPRQLKLASQIHEATHHLFQQPFDPKSHQVFMSAIADAGAWGHGMAWVKKLMEESQGDDRVEQLCRKTLKAFAMASTWQRSGSLAPNKIKHTSPTLGRLMWLLVGFFFVMIWFLIVY